MNVAARALYRGRQFLEALRPRIDASLRDEALARLGNDERVVFSMMTERDQQHCLAVYQRLREGRHDDPDLLTAALLHDVGKGRLAVWHRVTFVLLEALSPVLVARIAADRDGAGWREALYRCRHHPELGAELARTAGSNDRVVALIGEEGHAALEEHLTALKAADDAA